MTDPLTATIAALTLHSPFAFGLVFLAGLVTSIGPCAAPRYIALAAIAGRGRRSIVPTLAFVSGLTAALMAIGFGAGLLGKLWSISTIVYAALAAGLVCSGAIMLVRAVPECCVVPTCASHRERPPHRRSLGAFFLLGAASALIVSPCCTPVVVTIIATSTAIGKPGAGALLLASYAFGHALPLFFAGSFGSIVRRIGLGSIPRQAVSIVAAVLVLTFGAYYAVLA